MKYFSLAKKDLPFLFEALKENKHIVAPVRKENQYIFTEVTDFSQITLDYLPTILPPKKYFLPPHEDLVNFQFGKVQATPIAGDLVPTVVFGMHTCDIAAVACLEIVFHNDPFDWFFTNREKSLFIVGYECMKPCDEKATCRIMDTHLPRGFYDLMLTDAGEKYILHVNSQAGYERIMASQLFKAEDETLYEGLKEELSSLRKKKQEKFPVNLKATYQELYPVFKNCYEHPLWEEIGARCLSCGNCTMVCPTCYCFDLYDEMDLKLQTGTRKRVWDSCQLHDFALVASGENFREKRSGRQRHRFLRKFYYPMVKYNKYFCIGCGRCTRTCMAHISLLETVNHFAEEYHHAQR